MSNSIRQISSFSGPYEWLSNFTHAPFEVGNTVWPTTEHWYQAAKCEDPAFIGRVLAESNPGKVKHFARLVPLRPDWEDLRKTVMWFGLCHKFRQNSNLMQLLVQTISIDLVEGNTWHDTYWGFCTRTGFGYNVLGRQLMLLRDCSHFSYQALLSLPITNPALFSSMETPW